MKPLTLLCLLFISASSWGQSSTATTTTNSGAYAGNNSNEIVLAPQFNSVGALQAPIVGTPQLQQPQIFGVQQRTAAAASIGMVAGYLKACQVKYTRSAQPEVRAAKGGSGHTELVFAPHPSYLALERSNGSVQVEEVTPPTFSQEEIHGVVCLGTVTVFSQDGATTGFETVVSDLSRFPFDNMKGVREVIIVAVPAGVASAGGVSSSAKSFGLGTGIAHVISALTVGTVTPSFSAGGGESKPQEWVGGTFIILGIAENGKNVSPNEFASMYNK